MIPHDATCAPGARGRSGWMATEVVRSQTRTHTASATSSIGPADGAALASGSGCCRWGSVRERAVDLHLDGALGEPFLLAALPVGGQVRGLAVRVEGGVVLVLLVEDEELGVLRRVVRAIDEAAGLRPAYRCHLIVEDCSRPVALGLCRPDS